ncbi:hypothetical protein ACFJIX_23740 [Roseateles sp. UC29_93]|uniref:hypothetical protein n=1 Tax=Roseateles sp. UC29_93 TaxID=3350177 RepID=UPI00366E6326
MPQRAADLDLQLDRRQQRHHQRGRVHRVGQRHREGQRARRPAVLAHGLHRLRHAGQRLDPQRRRRVVRIGHHVEGLRRATRLVQVQEQKAPVHRRQPAHLCARQSLVHLELLLEELLRLLVAPGGQQRLPQHLAQRREPLGIAAGPTIKPAQPEPQGLLHIAARHRGGDVSILLGKPQAAQGQQQHVNSPSMRIECVVGYIRMRLNVH